MVNVVPREVPRPKPEGPQAPRVLTMFQTFTYIYILKYDLDKDPLNTAF